MSALDRADADRLIKLLGMLGSSFDGERAAAGLKASEFLRHRGLTWRDIILPALASPRPEPPPDGTAQGWRDMVAACLLRGGLLTDWETTFLQSLRYRSRLTPKQRAVLDRIVEKVAEASR